MEREFVGDLRIYGETTGEMTVTLNRITPGAAASTSNISSIATLVSAWKVGRRNRPVASLTDSILMGSRLSARMSVLLVPLRER